MRSKLKIPAMVVLVMGFVAITVGLILSDQFILPLFSLYLLALLGIQFLGYGPPAYVLMGFSSFLGIFCVSRVGENHVMAIPILIITMFGCAFLMQLILNKKQFQMRRERGEVNHIAGEKKVLEREILFYEEQKKTLLKRAEQRGKLVLATRELGALLDPTEIQNCLMDLAGKIFPGRSVEISYGQNQDSVDAAVVQRRQPVMIPEGKYPGVPLLAVPIFAQRSVAGILRVGGNDGPPFSREDLRLLEILGSMASMALDNGLLFTQVQESALRDNLTGLLTHRAFLDHLESQILEASRFGQRISVILTDVDHFKSVNDNYGHQAGDQILQGFAHVLDRNVREVDVLARYGGEEFIIMMLQTSHEEAMKAAEKVRKDIEGQDFDSGAKSLRITGSFGVATFPEDATSAAQLIRKADERLYMAKQAGRNRVRGQGK